MSNSIYGNMTSRLIKINQNDSVEQALMVMRNHNIRHLPVIDEHNNYVGIVSDRDLFKSLNHDETQVKNIMTTQVLKFELHSKMQNVVSEMLRLKISAFLIEKDKQVIGIITSEDLLHLLSQLLENQQTEPTVLEEVMLALNNINIPLVGSNVIT